MIFTPLSLEGAFEIEIERHDDERGFFARLSCEREMTAHGLNGRFPQTNTSFNTSRATLRGMHYQRPPFGEAKMVRCTRGSAFDAIIDLRPESRTYRQWTSVTLDAERRNAIYIPEGFAHGFVTLQDQTELFYYMSREFEPSAASGVRWNDPAFAIEWPVAPAVIAARDASYADFA